MLPTFIKYSKANHMLGTTSVVGAGYDPENNRRLSEDDFGQHTVMVECLKTTVGK